MNLELLIFLLAPAGALLTLATTRPRLFLSISRLVFWLLVLLGTAMLFWSLGIWQANTALLTFIRADAAQDAGLAIRGLEIPLAFHLGLTGNLLGYGIAHLLVSKADEDKRDIKHD